jgi:CRP-like cAMP-binding protein
MNTDLLFDAISAQVDLNAEESDFIRSTFTKKTAKKKDVLLREGEKCDNIYFLNTGILRAFVIGKKDKESTIMFAKKGWWITDMYCFLNQKPSMTYIEALSDAELLVLTKYNFDEILIKLPKMEKFFRILMQNAYTREQLRVTENLTLTAEARYENFIKKYPDLISQITLKQIASYIGISPEFLSALRAKM